MSLLMMKRATMKTFKNIQLKYFGLALLLLAMVLITGCGAKIIKGAAPMVRMNELSHQDNSISLELSMRNLNGVELDIQTIDFSLSVNDDELFSYRGPVDTNIVANGTETWSVEVEESESSRELLETLQSGEIKSLPYSLKGSVYSQEDGNLRFEHEGHIYPLPGRPGHFR
jgi:outer membrane lipoprotein-sorting protein